MYIGLLFLIILALVLFKSEIRKRRVSREFAVSKDQAAGLIMAERFFDQAGRAPLKVRIMAAWCSRFSWPRMSLEVREYIIEKNQAAAIAACRTDEERGKLAGQMMEGALGLEEDQISPELRDRLVAEAFKLWPQEKK